jgi:hypothetical protein
MKEKKKSGPKVVERPPVQVGRWLDEIAKAVGNHIVLETGAGSRRSGKVTALRLKEIWFNGEKVQFPYAVELNGDPADVVAIEGCYKIEIQ